MATLNLYVRQRWWVRPLFSAVYRAAVAASFLRLADGATVLGWGDWALRIIADRGLIFEVR